MCCCALGCVLKDQWSPNTTAAKLIRTTVEMLRNPDLGTICHQEHLEWPQDPAGAAAKARVWTERHAMGGRASAAAQCNLLWANFEFAKYGVSAAALGHLDARTIATLQAAHQ